MEYSATVSMIGVIILVVERIFAWASTIYKSDCSNCCHIERETEIKYGSIPKSP
jgi:hypothetical protein